MTDPIGKACPVVLRHRPDGADILVFRHPLAGMQLVSGIVAADEKPTRTAQRDLFERAGVPTTAEARLLGSDDTIEAGDIWHFVLCPVADLPEDWTFFTHQGGHLLAFSWQPLDGLLHATEWDLAQIQALTAIRRLASELRP